MSTIPRHPGEYLLRFGVWMGMFLVSCHTKRQFQWLWMLGNNPFGAASLWERVSGDAISAAISEKKNPPKEFQAHLDIPANASVEASKVERGSPTRILKNEC